MQTPDAPHPLVDPRGHGAGALARALSGVSASGRWPVAEQAG